MAFRKAGHPLAWRRGVAAWADVCLLLFGIPAAENCLVQRPALTLCDGDDIEGKMAQPHGGGSGLSQAGGGGKTSGGNGGGWQAWPAGWQPGFLPCLCLAWHP